MPQPRYDDAKVIRFVPGMARARPAPRADEERGRVLLFTGVRYQRLPDAASFAAAAFPNGAPEDRLHS